MKFNNSYILNGNGNLTCEDWLVSTCDMDFSIAFDTVDHDVLLRILSYFKFPIPLIKLLPPYLKNTKQ